MLNYSPIENVSTFANYFFYKNDSLMRSLKEKYDLNGSVKFNISSLSKINFPLVCTKNRKSIHVFKYFDGDAYKIQFDKTLNWHIENEFAKIESWDCQKATVNYGNRTWIAWFTKEIPLPIGPYVFGNLPGLIVQLKDTENEFNFSLLEIIKSDHIYQLPSLFEKAIATSIKKYEKVYKNYLLDPGKKLRDGYIVDNQSGEVFHINGGFSESYIKKKTEEIKKHIEENNNFIER